MNNYKENLKKYVKEDFVYQDYLKNQTKDFNDFEQFCIEHCENILSLLEENEKLEKQLLEKKDEDELL